MSKYLDHFLQMKEELPALYFDKAAVFRPTEKKGRFGDDLIDGKELVYQDIPCRLTFKKSNEGQPSGTLYSDVAQTISLMYPPEYEITAGDVIDVTRHTGEMESFESAGIPMRRVSHSSIELKSIQEMA